MPGAGGLIFTLGEAGVPGFDELILGPWKKTGKYQIGVLT